VHAYAHALSTIISSLRSALALCPPINDQHTLSAIWVQYEKYEEVLVALSSLYERVRQKSMFLIIRINTMSPGGNKGTGRLSTL
jgi:hypothetical protein